MTSNADFSQKIKHCKPCWFFSQKINAASHDDFPQKIHMASHADFSEKFTWQAKLIFLKKLT